MKRMNKIFATSALLIYGIALAQTSSVPSDKNSEKSENSTVEKVVLSPKEQIEENISRMKNDPVLKTANWGFVVYDTQKKQVITEYNSDTPLIPASTTKLLSTDASMALLGGKFRWITQLEYSGEISPEGTLNGDLFIIGSGDPSIGSGKAGAASTASIAADYLDKIKSAGIKKITGNIIVETAVYQDVRLELPEKIVWIEHNNYYLPVGNTSSVDPKSEKVAVKAKSIFDTSKRYFYQSPFTHRMAFTEKFDANSLVTTIPAAPALLGNTLRTKLIASKIPISGKVLTRVTDPNPEPREFLAKYSSPTMVDIIYYTNQHSDNALAEALLKTVGFYKTGNISLESGRETIVRHLQDKKYDFEGLTLIDGSGLSRGNKVKPISQVKFLAAVMKEKYYDDFLTSLPIAGETGTLRRMFKTSDNHGQIFAKTGTLNGVKCLAGYIKTKSGKILTFSLLINGYKGSVDQVKSKMEYILEPVVNL